MANRDIVSNKIAMFIRLEALRLGKTMKNIRDEMVANGFKKSHYAAIARSGKVSWVRWSAFYSCGIVIPAHLVPESIRPEVEHAIALHSRLKPPEDRTGKVETPCGNWWVPGTKCTAGVNSCSTLCATCEFRAGLAPSPHHNNRFLLMDFYQADIEPDERVI